MQRGDIRRTNAAGCHTALGLSGTDVRALVLRDRSVGGTRERRWLKAFFFFELDITFIVCHPCLDDSVPIQLCDVNQTHPELQLSNLPAVMEARHVHACSVWKPHNLRHW
jgi:hypothetical protein